MDQLAQTASLQTDDLGLLAAYGFGFMFLIFALLVWTAIWKGIALWKAARNGHTAWYVVLLLLNTAGILEIIYIFTVGKNKGKK